MTSTLTTRRTQAEAVGRTTLPYEVDVILVRPQGPINIGLVARACQNLAARRLIIVDPLCDLAHHLIAQFAHGAHAQLANLRIAQSLPDALAGCSLSVAISGRHHKAPLPIYSGDMLGQISGPIAVVFGNEQHGLSRAETALCDVCWTLPSDIAQPSYNLSHAVVLTLFAIRYPGAPNWAARPKDAKLSALPRSTRVHLQAAWHAMLASQGYFTGVDQARFVPKLKRFVDTLPLTASQVRFLTGMLRHLTRRP